MLTAADAVPARSSGTPPRRLASLRPHQWTKNLVVFAALALSKHLFEPSPSARVRWPSCSSARCRAPSTC